MTEPIVAIVRKSNKWPSVRSFNIHTLPQPAHRHHRARAAVSARPDVDCVHTLDTLDSVHTLDSVRKISPCGHWTLRTGHVAAETERGHHAAPAAPPPGGPTPRPALAHGAPPPAPARTHRALPRLTLAQFLFNRLSRRFSRPRIGVNRYPPPPPPTPPPVTLTKQLQVIK